MTHDMGRARIIMLGYLIYLFMSLGFAFATTEWQVIVLFVIYSVFYSVDEAQSKAFIAHIELERRASAIGVYNFVTGIIYLPASLIAGALWLMHPASAFIVAACLAFFAIVAFVILRPALPRVSGVFPAKLNCSVGESPALHLARVSASGVACRYRP